MESVSIKRQIWFNETIINIINNHIILRSYFLKNENCFLAFLIFGHEFGTVPLNREIQNLKK